MRNTFKDLADQGGDKLLRHCAQLAVPQRVLQQCYDATRRRQFGPSGGAAAFSARRAAGAAFRCHRRYLRHEQAHRLWPWQCDETTYVHSQPLAVSACISRNVSYGKGPIQIRGKVVQ